MNCQETQELMSDVLGDAASDEECAAFEAHIGSCDACRKEFEDLKRDWDLLDSFSVPEVSDGFTASVMQKVKAGKPLPNSEGNHKSRLRVIALITSLAACLAFAFATILSLPAPKQRPTVSQITANDLRIVEDLEIYENMEMLQDLELLSRLDTLQEDAGGPQ